jgi:predicted enzyme related to lactoylglutathione lyase
MSDVRPTGTTRNVQYGFSKIFVRDLEAMATFYQEVFGLIPFNRHQDVMIGDRIDEITYQASHPGGSSLTLIQHLDSSAPSAGGAVQGFITSDLDALVARARAAGGSIPEPIRRIDEFKLRVVFVLDPEGHINEVVQLDAA